MEIVKVDDLVRVYVAGPLSGTAQQYLENMRRMITISTHLWSMGLAPYCPCLDYHYALMRSEPDAMPTVQKFYDASLAWVQPSHALLLLPGWKYSKGTKGEIDRALMFNIPIFHKPSRLLDFFGFPPDPTLDVLFEKWEGEK